ncbi:MAG TPA: hypothetical protein VGB85_26925 [Nannocystis sp.]|jgi:hypothetical protein
MLLDRPRGLVLLALAPAPACGGGGGGSSSNIFQAHRFAYALGYPE